MRSRAVHVWVVIVLLHAAQTIYYFPRLPAVVAQHFDAAGRANGWTTREGFFIFSWVVVLGLSAIVMLMPLLLRRTPISMINLPNKGYWLAPERKEESISYMERQLEWMGVLTVGFLVIVMNLAIRANLDPAHRLESWPFLVLLSAFVATMFWWTMKLFRRFPNPKR